MRVLIAALVLGLCAYQTSTRLEDWRSDQALWTAAARTEPTSARAALMVAAAALKTSQWTEAVRWHQRGVQLAAGHSHFETVIASQRIWLGDCVD